MPSEREPWERGNPGSPHIFKPSSDNLNKRRRRRVRYNVSTRSQPSVQAEIDSLDTPRLDREQDRSWIKEVDRLLRGESTSLSALRDGGIQVASDRLQLAIVLLGMAYG